MRIEGGDYLVFTGQGEMPQMVLAVWQTIWQYFEAHPEIKRLYRSDFEAYSGPEQVAIHIGVDTGLTLKSWQPSRTEQQRRQDASGRNIDAHATRQRRYPNRSHRSRHGLG